MSSNRETELSNEEEVLTLAARVLEDARLDGKSIEIPSIGLVISPREEGEEDKSA